MTGRTNIIVSLLVVLLMPGVHSEEAYYGQADAVFMSTFENVTVGTMFGGMDESAGIVHFIAPISVRDKVDNTRQDTVAPEIILIQPPSIPSSVNGFNVSFTARDTGSGIKTVRFVYRFGGELTSRVDTLVQNMGIYNKAISAINFSLRGFTWHVEIMDSANNKLVYQSPNEASHVSVPGGVLFSKESGSPLPSDKWCFVSLPFVPMQSNANAILSTTLGNHDGKQWKMVYWNGSKYVSINDEQLNFVPGKSFYVYSRNKTIDFTTGPLITTNINEPYPIQLRMKGWTHIAVPFAFPVKWKDCFRNGMEMDLWRLEGPIPDPVPATYSGLTDPETVLYPWKGYWVYNPNNSVCTLMVSPVSYQYSGKLQKDKNGHFITLSSSSGKAVVIGKHNAENKSVPMPPSPDNSENIYIPCSIKGHLLARYTPVAEGNTLVDSLELSTMNNKGTELLVNFSNYVSGSRLVLLNRVTGKLHEITGNGERVFVEDGKWLFVSGATDSIMPLLRSSLPYSFTVSPPSPNPFNPFISVLVGIPQLSKNIHLTFYLVDCRGTIVYRKSEYGIKPGWHHYTINTTNAGYRSISAGVYMLRIAASGENIKWNKTFRTVYVK